MAESVDPIFVFNYAVVGLVILFNIVIAILLFRKYMKRKRLVALYLAFTSICLNVATLYAFLKSLFPSWSVMQSPYSDIVAFVFVGLTNIPLYLTIHEIFMNPGKKFRKIMFLSTEITIAIQILLTIYGLIVSPSEIPMAILLVYVSCMFYYYIISIYLYAFLLYNSYKIMKRVDDPLGKRGFKYLILFSLLALIFMPLNYVTSIPVRQDHSVVYGLVWMLAIGSSLFAYLGFIFPFKHLKEE